jgi:hypothetical protein
MACHLQVDADADAGPVYHFDVDPNPTYHVEADPDLTFPFDADPVLDPHHCNKILPRIIRLHFSKTYLCTEACSGI